MRFHFYFFSLVTLAALTISATVYTRASQTQAPVAIEAELTDFGHIYPQARISSPFGLRLHPVHRKESMHLGIDFALPNGTPVRAAEGGVVAQVANEAERSTYGRYLRICHADGYSSLYAHLSHIDVRVG